MPTYAVTGASGPFGRHAIENLLTRGVPATDVVAVVRDPAKVSDLAERGVDVRVGDYSRPETLSDAFAGVRRLLFVSGNEMGHRIAQHAAVVEAAKAAGVERVVYTSILRADTTGNPIAPEHLATEELLASSGVSFTVLRNGWYIENYTERIGEYVDRGEIVGAAGDAKVAAATRGDYAEAAGEVLIGDGHEKAYYELGGAAFGFADLAATVTAVTGKTVAYRDLTPVEYVAELERAGLDGGTAAFVASLDESIARGELETSSDDLPRLLGRPATPLADAVRAAMSF